MRTAPTAYTKQAKDRQAKYLIGGVIVATALIFGIQVIMKPPALNCRAPAASKTVILIDRSEELAQQTIDEIVARVLDHIRSRPVGERVAIFAITDSSSTSLAPLYDDCRPKTGAEASDITEDVQRIDRRFNERFISPITAVLRNPVQDAHSSPIAQVLTDLSVSSFLNGPENHLLVFSDMLEHTSRFSLYTCTDPVRVIPLYRESRAGALERPTFTNVTVALNLIPRGDIAVGTIRCRDQLWPWFFGDTKGRTAGLDLRYLPGGPRN